MTLPTPNPCGTDHAVSFILETTWESLPAAVQRQSRRCLLDGLGVLMAGTATPVGRLMAEFAAAQFAGDEATVLASGAGASALGAALANGFAANALDMDDGYRLIKGHLGACLLPALLAASESRGPVTGDEFLAALIVGYEIGVRAALIRHATYPTYHSSGSWGAIAAAAAAARLLRLDRPTLRHALGAAEYHAPIAPMMKGIAVPSMGKDSIGWGAMVGMASVLMAQRGFTGIEPLFSESPEVEWIERLGRSYEVLNLYFKPYACCRWAQPAVVGALAITQEHGLATSEIAGIKVRTFTEATRLSRSHPRDTEEAQYNLTYPVAAALVDGELGPRQMLPPRIHDSALLAIADRITVESAPEYDRAFPAKAYADVTVTTRDGRAFAARRKQAIWEPPDTLPTDSELEHKFFQLVRPLVGTQRASAIVTLVAKFEGVADIRDLIGLCMVEHERQNALLH